MKHHRHLWLKCCHQNCFGREDIIHAHVLQNVEFQEFPMRSVWSKGKKSGWLTRSSFVSRFHQRKGTTRCVLDNPVQDVKRGAREENEKIGNEGDREWNKMWKKRKNWSTRCPEGKLRAFFLLRCRRRSLRKTTGERPPHRCHTFLFRADLGAMSKRDADRQEKPSKKRISFFFLLLLVDIFKRSSVTQAGPRWKWKEEKKKKRPTRDW